MCIGGQFIVFLCVFCAIPRMNQETYNSEMAYSHAGNESVSWGGAMGPLGPLAMFGQGLSDTQPTSTPTRRFDAPHQEASTDHPDRQC